MTRAYADGIEDAAEHHRKCLPEIENMVDKGSLSTAPGDITWHCSEDDGGPDVGVSLQISPGIELWCGEVTDSALANTSPDVRDLDPQAGGSWLVLYASDSVEVIGKVGDFEGRHLLEEVLAPAIRTLSTSPSGIDDAREALTAASEIVAWWPDEIDLVRHIRTAPSRKGIDIARHVLAYFEPAHRLATLCESASSKIGGDHG